MQDMQDSRYSWFRLAVTLLIATVVNVGIWIVVMVLPAMEADFGASRADSSLPYVFSMVGFALGNMVLGRMVDRYGITTSLIGASVAITASFALSTLAGSMLTLSVIHLVLGLATGVGFGPLIADISHWFLRNRGVAVALAAAGNYLSGAIWPVLLSGVLEQSGWQAVYLWLAVAVPVLVVPLSLILRRRPHWNLEAAGGMGSINRGDVRLSPRALQLLLGCAGVFCCVAMSMPQVHIVAYCVGLGFGTGVGSEMLSLMLWGGVVSRLISGMVADRIGGLMTLLAGAILQCFALALFLPWDGMVPLYIVSLAFGLSQGGIVPSYAMVVREYMPAREAGARVGFVMMLTIMGMALGGWLSGWIYDLTNSYQLAFVNGIGWNLVNIVIISWLVIRARQTPTAAPA